MSKVKPLKFKKMYVTEIASDSFGWYAVVSNNYKTSEAVDEHTQRSFVTSTPSEYKDKEEAFTAANRIAASFGAELVDMRKP